MSTLSRTATLVAALAIACASPTLVAAQEAAPAASLSPEARAEASAHFRRAVGLYGEGDYENALVEFERAYQAAPSYAVLYNIGQARLVLRDYVGALRAFEQYLEQGGEAIAAERRAEVEGNVAIIQTRIAHLTVRVSVPGAQVSLDDEPVGLAPLGIPLAVSIGRHRVAVRADGYEPWEESVTVAGGDQRELTATLREERPREVVLTSLPQEGESHALQTAGIAGLVVTGGAVIGGVVTGTLAFLAHERLDQELGTFPGDPEAIESARNEASALNLATDVLGAAAIVLGGVSLALVIVDSGGEEDDEAQADEPSVSVAVGPASVAARVRF